MDEGLHFLDWKYIECRKTIEALQKKVAKLEKENEELRKKIRVLNMEVSRYVNC